MRRGRFSTGRGQMVARGSIAAQRCAGGIAIGRHHDGDIMVGQRARQRHVRHHIKCGQLDVRAFAAGIPAACCRRYPSPRPAPAPAGADAPRRRVSDKAAAGQRVFLDGQAGRLVAQQLRDHRKVHAHAGPGPSSVALSINSSHSGRRSTPSNAMLGELRHAQPGVQTASQSLLRQDGIAHALVRQNAGWAVSQSSFSITAATSRQLRRRRMRVAAPRDQHRVTSCGPRRRGAAPRPLSAAPQAGRSGIAAAAIRCSASGTLSGNNPLNVARIGRDRASRFPPVSGGSPPRWAIKEKIVG